MNQEKSAIWGNRSEKPYIFGRTIADDVKISIKRNQNYYDNLFEE